MPIEIAASLDAVSVDICNSRGRTRVLDDVSLELPAGQVTAVVGESGCGKSMIAAALSGLLPPCAVVDGVIRIQQRVLDGQDQAWRRVRGRQVGVIPQSAITSFTPVTTIGRQLTEVVVTLGSRYSVTELCRATQYPLEALHLYPHQLSGGMAQRAAIAAAFAGDRSVILADEPTSALDPELANAVWALLVGAADAGAAVLVITHDVDALVHAPGTPSVVVMREGRIHCHGGSVAGLQSSTDPYVADLMAAI